MNSRIPFLSLILAVVFGVAAAGAKSIELLAAAEGDTYFVCVIESDDTRERIVSVVRQRNAGDGGRWDEVGTFQSRVTSLAVSGGRPAVLTGDGMWRLDRNVLGPPLPAGRIERLATAPLGMLAAGVTPQDGGRGAVRTIWRWTGTTWQRVTDLPAGWDAPNGIVETGGDIFVSGAAAQSPFVARFSKGVWETVATDVPPDAALLPARDGYALLRRDASGLHLERAGGSTRLDAGGFDGPIVAAVAGQALHLLRPGQKAVDQLTFEISSGRRLSGPDPVAAGGEAPPATPVWSQFGVMLLLGIAVLLTMRQSPAPPPELLAAADILLAPLGRRLVAGLIDALPYLVGTFVTFSLIADGKVAMDRSMLTVTPTLIGLVLYVGHTAVAEALGGRSIGKLLLGLRVVAYDGGPPDRTRLVMRNVLRLVDIAMIVPLLLILLSPTRQRIGDLACGTLVVRAGPPRSQPPEGGGAAST
ncbi:MAG TPA: RDD family protein [Tepidisphaeraceae bacterium]|jgi:uncharacterized RDD family membrane protein YckC